VAGAKNLPGLALWLVVCFVTAAIASAASINAGPFYLQLVRPLAGALLVPYLLWASFAAVLNYAVWQLNPQLLG
jgi:tryptophan-rich sensory protein